MACAATNIPEIGQADFHSFHEAHFSQLAADHFLVHFLRPDHRATEDSALDNPEDEYYEDEEDDGLGYYDDGVKRTLTDEQIAIFRHSELEALRRAQESPKRKRVTTVKSSSIDEQDVDEGQLSEEGELSSATPPMVPPKKKKKKNNRKRAQNKNDTGEQIDLRKRTWDVVDKGLPTLDYDEENHQIAQGNTAQRQCVSYDD
ncbi:hypothetical protein B0H66DRAFT_48241 [Apodospora peruviana]|uniref:Uncharacterized protein n=1 Tax=Apodospora peruviana TaxID=516989 RepID=A0AAE0MFC1_9PEZI|nr:hypothetical protein B0H66DRAFT_48241 [Apodospora peruviana]